MSNLAPAVQDAAEKARLAYGPAEAAHLLGVSRAMLYELMTRGEIASLKIGSRRLIRHETLVGYLDRVEQGGPG